MGEDCDGKCRDQFPGYLELVQKRTPVCGLARSVIRCFLGSGVLLPDAHCTLSLRYVYRGTNIPNSRANNKTVIILLYNEWYKHSQKKQHLQRCSNE